MGASLLNGLHLNLMLLSFSSFCVNVTLFVSSHSHTTTHAEPIKSFHHLMPASSSASLHVAKSRDMAALRSPLLIVYTDTWYCSPGLRLPIFLVLVSLRTCSVVISVEPCITTTSYASNTKFKLGSSHWTSTDVVPVYVTSRREGASGSVQQSNTWWTFTTLFRPTGTPCANLSTGRVRGESRYDCVL